MKKKYSIGLFLLLLCIAVFSGAYYISYQRAKERQLSELEEYRKIERKNSSSNQEETVRTKGAANKADGYYIVENNGYLVVYLADKTTVFEYTNIAFETLPEELKEEIKTEKFIATQEEVIGFLENYSS